MTDHTQAASGYVATVGRDIDVAELTELVISVEDDLDGSPRATESFVRMLLNAPHTQDMLSLMAPNTGQLAGFGLLQNAEPHVESVTSGWVHPLHRGRGLGDTIVRWGLETARSQIAMAPDGTRVTNRCQASDADTGAVDVFTGLGYHSDRHDIEMEIVFDGSVAVTPLPPGIAVRTMSGAHDLHTVAAVVAEAFRDHYGWVESSADQRIERWENFRAMDEWDDDLVFIAEADGDAVGACVGIRTHGAIIDAGFIGSLAVVRTWRGRGLAKALLTMAFERFNERGMRSVALDVDADSLTGATRLYRGVGMKPVRSETAYLIEVRSGVELVRR